MRHASHPNRSFNELQRIADFAGPHAATFAAGSAARPGADARACWHAAALAVRRGPRASWGTGRGNRNSMKISARRDGDHARRAGLARPPDVHRPRRCPLQVDVTAMDFSGCQLLGPRCEWCGVCETWRRSRRGVAKPGSGDRRPASGQRRRPTSASRAILRRTPAVRLYIAYPDLGSNGCARHCY